MSRAPSGSSVACIARTSACSVWASAARSLVGCGFFSSMTWATSSCDQASAAGAPCDANTWLAIGATSPACVSAPACTRARGRRPRTRAVPPAAAARRARGSCRRANALADAAQEDADHFAGERVLEELVLTARVDARVVVDLDHVAALPDELQVHAVQSVADQIGRAQCRVHDNARRLADGERRRLAFVVAV